MANFVLQYDLNLNYIDAKGIPRSTAYNFVARNLHQQGLTRYQQSCCRADNVAAGPFVFHLAVQLFASTVEARFGVGIFRHLHYEQRFNFVPIR